MFFYPHVVFGSPNPNEAENLSHWWHCFCFTKESSFVISVNLTKDLLHLSPHLVKTILFIPVLIESQTNMLTETCSWPGPEDWLLV